MRACGLKSVVPILCLLGAVYYGIPLVSFWLGDAGNFLTGMAMLAVFPAASLLACWIDGSRYGFRVLPPLLCGLLFLPSVPIFFNSSALIYAAAYAVLGFIGEAVGLVQWRRRNQSGVSH